jgi:hypothetical protein
MAPSKPESRCRRGDLFGYDGLRRADVANSSTKKFRCSQPDIGIRRRTTGGRFAAFPSPLFGFGGEDARLPVSFSARKAATPEWFGSPFPDRSDDLGENAHEARRSDDRVRDDLDITAMVTSSGRILCTRARAIVESEQK